MITFYHKSNCATSIAALQLLKKELKKTKEPLAVIEYLFNTPSEKELKAILKMLNMKAEQLVRKKESVYKENFEGKKLTNAQWIKILIKNPILIERPVVIRNNKAIIARPPESVIDFIRQ